MGYKFSKFCLDDVDNIYEPQNILINPKSNIIRRNNSQNNLKTPLYNSQPLIRKPSFVRFVETTNKDLKICDLCKNLDNSLIQFNQCIDCGLYHCGYHRIIYHESMINKKI
jgi:hypothetical protein